MKKFLVALAVGGVTEKPEITYSNHQIIEAKNSVEACIKYNRENKCSYFYGECLGEFDEESKKVSVPITVFIKSYR